MIVAIESAGSPVLSGRVPGKHGIAGIGAGFYPGVLNTKIYDKVIKVEDEYAERFAQLLAKREGLVVGI